MTNLVKTSNIHIPKKTKVFRGNHKPHINKFLRKAIMKKPQLKNKESKTKDPWGISRYKSRRNLLIKMNKKVSIKKPNYCDNVETGKNPRYF